MTTHPSAAARARAGIAKPAASAARSGVDAFGSRAAAVPLVWTADPFAFAEAMGLPVYDTAQIAPRSLYPSGAGGTTSDPVRSLQQHHARWDWVRGRSQK